MASSILVRISRTETWRAVGLSACLLALLTAPGCVSGRGHKTADESLVVFLVRHAEKSADREDPALSAAGKERTRSLAGLLRDAAIESVYSTDFRRTRETAAPLAAQLELDITIYDPTELAGLAADLQRQGGRSLVVGHSNTTPELVALLGGDPGAPIDEESEYDRLYVVTIGTDGAVETVVLRY